MRCNIAGARQCYSRMYYQGRSIAGGKTNRWRLAGSHRSCSDCSLLLPAHALLVYVSGACEVLGGIGVFVPATRVAAGIGLIALLCAVTE